MSATPLPNVDEQFAQMRADLQVIRRRMNGLLDLVGKHNSAIGNVISMLSDLTHEEPAIEEQRSERNAALRAHVTERLIQMTEQERVVYLTGIRDAARATLAAAGAAVSRQPSAVSHSAEQRSGTDRRQHGEHKYECEPNYFYLGVGCRGTGLIPDRRVIERRTDQQVRA